MRTNVNSTCSSKRRSLRSCVIALICALVTPGLMSCSTGTAVTQAPLPLPPVPPMPATLKAECPELPAAKDDLWETLLGNHDQVAALHHDCRNQQRRLTQAVSDWEATAWGWYCTAVTQLQLPVEACAREGGTHDQGR